MGQGERSIQAENGRTTRYRLPSVDRAITTLNEETVTRCGRTITRG